MKEYSSDYDPPVGSKLLLHKLITVVYLLQLLAGIVLSICGTMSLKMTAGQADSHGPPYFIGTFIVGVQMLLSGAIWSMVYGSRHRMLSRKHRPNNCVVALIVTNHILGFTTLTGSIVGLILCVRYGLYKCTPYEVHFPDHTCNYTINFRENYSLAILEIAFLSATILLSLLVITVTTWCLRMLRLLHCGANTLQFKDTDTVPDSNTKHKETDKLNANIDENRIV